jgi:hypothetical protein
MNEHMDKLVYSDAPPEKMDVGADAESDQTVVRKLVYFIS